MAAIMVETTVVHEAASMVATTVDLEAALKAGSLAALMVDLTDACWAV